MRQYLDFPSIHSRSRNRKDDRTHTGTISAFGYQMRFPLSEGFPLLTTKKVHLKSILHELLWFIHGDTNIRYLVQNDVRIWNDWPFAIYQKSPDYHGETMEEFIQKIKTDSVFAALHGELGPVYGKQWRAFEGKDGRVVDQLQKTIAEIRSNPDSRRLIVSSWNVPLIDEMALPPCHTLFQFYVSEGKLSCQLYQRSADAFLGVSFNIASYALLTLMVAHVCGLEPGDFVHTFGDYHILPTTSIKFASNYPEPPRTLPKLLIKRSVSQIEEFRFEDFELVGYNPYPSIKGKVAV